MSESAEVRLQKMKDRIWSEVCRYRKIADTCYAEGSIKLGHQYESFADDLQKLLSGKG